MNVGASQFLADRFLTFLVEGLASNGIVEA